MYPVAPRSFRDPQKAAKKVERQPLLTCVVEDNDIIGDKNLCAGDLRIVVNRKSAKISTPLRQ